ncbi:MAG: peptidase U32 family protein [Desulfobulbales bacterium]|nr:peptidase U32 family protein [Desulfobulbales bacterium]
MTIKQRQKPELLAPAGTVNVFEKAIESGADAVYVGAPALNARALAKDFSLPEIAAMIDFAHRRNVKLYLAANSLLKEDEIPRALETLAVLEALQPDGLIVQDLGVYHLCRTYFPGLRLHASTLLGAHNSLAVRQFAGMGFKRVVLARELTIKEITSIARQSEVELEVFIHGALCFSYSGLCLFSSYLGGKSGLRGRCVQPCRRRYQWRQQGEKPGYYFSMNDLSSIDLIHRLGRAGITSFKIEGRLRSAHYVASVVKAYRMVIDADKGDKKTLENARELLNRAMGRKTSQGYFTASQAKKLISPYHSGNIGMYLGKAGKGTGRGRVFLALKDAIQVGDRLRLHQEDSGERVAFTLRNVTRSGRKVAQAKPGDRVILEVPAPVKQGDSLFKVDSRKAREAEKRTSGLDGGQFKPVVKKIQQKNKQPVLAVQKKLAPAGERNRKTAATGRRGRRGTPNTRPQLFIKIDNLQALKIRLPHRPAKLLVELNRKTYNDFKQLKKNVMKFQHKMIWCLPPVIPESEIDFFSRAVDHLIKNKFRSWQIGHLGQQLFFAGKQRLELSGDYTLNVLNSQTLLVLKDFNLLRAQAAIEIDRKSLENILQSDSAVNSRLDIGMTVYGTPPLFTARPMASHFKYAQPFISPKGESFILRKAWNSTLALAEKPFSMLMKLAELAEMGLKFAVIDLSHGKVTRRENDQIARELAGKRQKRKLSMFNYDGELL